MKGRRLSINHLPEAEGDDKDSCCCSHESHDSSVQDEDLVVKAKGWLENHVQAEGEPLEEDPPALCHRSYTNPNVLVHGI